MQSVKLYFNTNCGRLEQSTYMTIPEVHMPVYSLGTLSADNIETFV
jgi:hypothetical protein